MGLELSRITMECIYKLSGVGDPDKLLFIGRGCFKEYIRWGGSGVKFINHIETRKMKVNYFDIDSREKFLRYVDNFLARNKMILGDADYKRSGFLSQRLEGNLYFLKE